MTNLTRKAPAAVSLGEVMLRLSPGTGQRIENPDAFTSRPRVARRMSRRRWRGWAFQPHSPGHSPSPSSVAGSQAELAAAVVQLRHADWNQDGRWGAFFVEQGVGARSSSVLYDGGGSTSVLRHGSSPTAVSRHKMRSNSSTPVRSLSPLDQRSSAGQPSTIQTGSGPRSDDFSP